jgi:hypothetical protein
MFTFPWKECPMFAMFSVRASTRNPLHRLQDFIKAPLTPPHRGLACSGYVTAVGNGDVVIESFASGIRHTGSSAVPVPVDGEGGSAIG